ncbi:MAG: 1-deoxy-D-xylulose-5-phosphate reductoisomerase [Clostridia bacterium]|nr:1-deoxy-D-xylulose-5-phosphate reductoisomerase [Clostridia bacterium]
MNTAGENKTTLGHDVTVTVLGSTGSVGMQTMDVAALHDLRVEAIAGGRNITRLEEQIRKFRPDFCAVEDEDAAKLLKIAVADTDTKILPGREGVIAAAAGKKSSVVLNSIIGTAGLEPTLTAIRAGKNVALANKETLVTAGEFVMREAREHGVSVLPVDSEHCAIFQCLNGEPKERVKKLLLTCSGGAFYGRKRAELSGVTRAEALAHPTWKMGPKITVDCASLMNKGLELIEAVRLFDVRPDQVQVLIHRESIVHSMVQYIDNAVMAQLSVPDMRLCIQYALTYPDRMPSCLEELDFLKAGRLTFAAPDEETFTLLPLAREAVTAGGTKTATLNGANEAAVALFLDDQITFTDIFDVVGEVVHGTESIPDPTLAEIEEADSAARIAVRDKVRSL